MVAVYLVISATGFALRSSAAEVSGPTLPLLDLNIGDFRPSDPFARFLDATVHFITRTVR